MFINFNYRRWTRATRCRLRIVLQTDVDDERNEQAVDSRKYCQRSSTDDDRQFTTRASTFVELS